MDVNALKIRKPWKNLRDFRFYPRFCPGRDACLDLATLLLSFPMDERNSISWLCTLGMRYRLEQMSQGKEPRSNSEVTYLVGRYFNFGIVFHRLFLEGVM